VELDDLTAPEVIEHIETQLEALGIKKVIPPEAVLAEKREQIFRTKVNEWVGEIIDEVLDIDGLKEKMAEEFEDRFKLQGAKAWIEGPLGFKGDDTLSWRAALKNTLQAVYEGKHKNAMGHAVQEYIQETIANDASGANAVED
jgi:hypothetical protein